MSPLSYTVFTPMTTHPTTITFNSIYCALSRNEQRHSGRKVHGNFFLQRCHLLDRRFPEKNEKHEVFSYSSTAADDDADCFQGCASGLGCRRVFNLSVSSATSFLPLARCLDRGSQISSDVAWFRIFPRETVWGVET